MKAYLNSRLMQCNEATLRYLVESANGSYKSKFSRLFKTALNILVLFNLHTFREISTSGIIVYFDTGVQGDYLYIYHMTFFAQVRRVKKVT